MRPIVDTDHVRDAVPGLRLAGDRLRATVYPDAGAKILVWCGGWDELFPTDAPCEVGYNTLTATATTLECVE